MYKIKTNVFSLLCFIIFLSACAEKTTAEINKDGDPSRTAAAPIIPEYRVIELYADATAKVFELDGIWESSCTKLDVNNSYYINRRIFHLDGFFQETAIYNDIKCLAKSSRNTLRIFGSIDSTETVFMSNGFEDVEVRKIKSSLLAAPFRGPIVPLSFLSLDDLTDNGTSTELFLVIENRLYIIDESNATLVDLLSANHDYLVNTEITTNGKSTADLDQEATDLFDPDGA